MADLIMPKMSDAMEEGKVLKWLKNEGDQVEKGEPIAEIETDKANVELEAPESGVIQKFTANEGDTVAIGTTIALIVPAGELAGIKGGAAPPAEAPPKAEEKPQPPREEEEIVPPEREAEELPSPAETTPPTMRQMIDFAGIGGEESSKSSPLARRIALDAGIDLKQVKGTGPGGRIVEADVREFIERGGKPRPQAVERKLETPTPPKEQPAPQAPPPPTEPPTPPTLAAKKVEVGNIWQTVGRLMTESKQQAPHFYVTMEIDMDEAIKVRQLINSTRHVDKQISLNDMIMKACALTLVKHPLLNASYSENGTIEMHDHINIGVAVAIPNGLIAPTIRNCEQKSLTAIADETRELIHKTRTGTIRPEEYSGATFTISNLGMYGVEEFSAIIVPPQAAILAVGAAAPIPVAVDDTVKIKNMMRITVSGDHRVTDGARVAEFMRDLKQILEQPMSLLE